MLNTPKERVAFFVDTWSLAFAERSLHRWVDYRKLLRYATGNELRRQLVIREAYVVDHPDGRKDGFRKALEAAGYVLHVKTSSKPFPSYVDFKSELTLHAVTRVEEYDVLCLASSDAAFTEMIGWVKARGKSVTLICFRENMSYQLLPHADEVKFITEEFLTPEV
jgi:uncharacterized LabA/DUF88 family protein